jgi:type I restriction enzyme R subunit
MTRAYLPFIQGKARVAHQEHCDVTELFGPDRESSNLEYKATLRTHADSGETFKPHESATLKTIAAFMNGREGGTLLIDVSDDGTIHGLDSDYASRPKQGQDPRDWFQQHLSNIISTSMGDAAGHQRAGPDAPRRRPRHAEYRLTHPRSPSTPP